MRLTTCQTKSHLHPPDCRLVPCCTAAARQREGNKKSHSVLQRGRLPRVRRLACNYCQSKSTWIIWMRMKRRNQLQSFCFSAAFRRFLSEYPISPEVDVKAELTEKRSQQIYNCRRHLHLNTTPTVCVSFVFLFFFPGRGNDEISSAIRVILN